MLVAALIAIVTLPSGQMEQYNEQVWQGNNSHQQCVKVLQSVPQSNTIQYQCNIVKGK